MLQRCYSFLKQNRFSTSIALIGVLAAFFAPNAGAARNPQSHTHAANHTHATANSNGPHGFLGFDRNNYPGDAALPALRKRFAFTGYWLTAPPSATTDTWAGRRKILLQRGFGFLVIFNGRLFDELQQTEPKTLGANDAKTAVAAARREGFPRGTIIFLDQEEGGRLLAIQRAYVLAWMDGVTAAGYRAGIYCSGTPSRDDSGEWITTAEDLRRNSARRIISYWVYNTAIPPSPGCKFARPSAPAHSGVKFASVWQFAQSPAPAGIEGSHGYTSNGQCYAPDSPAGQQVHLDLDSATSSDPSRGRGIGLK